MTPTQHKEEDNDKKDKDYRREDDYNEEDIDKVEDNTFWLFPRAWKRFQSHFLRTSIFSPLSFSQNVYTSV